LSEFIHRKPGDAEQLVSDYEAFVADIADGFWMCVYEYTNDLSCRQLIEEAKTSPEIQRIWPRIDAADQALKRILLPTKLCIHGDYSESHFWYWGYPPNSPELESDLRSVGAI